MLPLFTHKLEIIEQVAPKVLMVIIVNVVFKNPWVRIPVAPKNLFLRDDKYFCTMNITISMSM